MASHVEVMDLLLKDGSDINATSKHGWTALMMATKRNDELCVQYLLDHRSDINHLSPDRWTALAEATTRGHIRIIEMLIDAGADPE
jgi:ankyrin repeat protein